MNESINQSKPTQQFSAISWREQGTFNEMMMVSALYRSTPLA